jgi:integrase
MSVYLPTYDDPKTGERMQSNTWWISFVYAGRRVRESAKTESKTIAVEFEKDRRKQLERAHAGLPSEKPTERIRSVNDVLGAYTETYGVNHPKSLDIVEERSPHLKRLLGRVLLVDLTPERILGYMATRQSEKASNRTINMELEVLSRAIGHPWKILWPKAKRLEENKDIGVALEPQAEQAVLEAAAKNRSKLILPYLYVLAWTGIRADEARMLTWAQVDFAGGDIIVGRSKTRKGKGRHIPMAANLRAVLEHYASWYASKLGPIQPTWFVFPMCNRTKPVDATKPVGSLKGAWEAVRETAGVTCRRHDLRHSFATKLSEAGVPESTMLELMGHMSAAMLHHYSHIRDRARRQAIADVERRHVSQITDKESAKVEPNSAENEKSKAASVN